MGLERAGWRTVSFSEIDPYASAVLAERWPGVPNLGDISGLRADVSDGRELVGPRSAELAPGGRGAEPRDAWTTAHLWSGGFPCQDLSVAGKRRGFGLANQRASGRPLRGGERDSSDGGGIEEHGSDGTHERSPDWRIRTTDGSGTRSGLAFTFLALVERYRPPAVLLENVPGLLSSHGGRDLGTLLGTLGQLGYWWAYRILDARHFGVPQRRRRVFIVALDAERHPDPDSAAAVLAVGSRCHRHPAAGVEAGQEPAPGPGYGIAHALSSSHTRSGRYDPNGESYVVSPSPDPRGVRATYELASGLDHREQLAATLNSGGNDGGFRTEPGEHLVAFVKSRNVDRADGEYWLGEETARAVALDGRPTSLAAGGGVSDDPLLPLGLDSHRYRCCGNGVVSSVAEWIGLRLAAALAPIPLDLSGSDVPVTSHLPGLEPTSENLLAQGVGSDPQ